MENNSIEKVFEQKFQSEDIDSSQNKTTSNKFANKDTDSIENESSLPTSEDKENVEDENLQEDKSVNVNKSDKEENEWLDIMGSGNFKKLILEKGLGHETRPERGEKVIVNINYFLDDKVLEQKENLEFIVGDMDVIQGLDLVVCLMEKNEMARVKVPSKLAYGKIGREPDIPPESDLEMEIKLLDVKTVDHDNLSISERLKLGEEKRLRGNFFYERTEYIEAIHCYERAAEYLEGVKDSSGTSTEESQKIIDMKIKVYNNLTASHLKLNAYQAALKAVESVLNIQPNNIKALYRKSKILSGLGLTDEAINCLKLAFEAEPETKVIQSELTKLNNRKRKEEESQKAMYKRMFPQTATKKATTSFTKILKIGAVTIGLVAVCAGMAFYKQLSS